MIGTDIDAQTERWVFKMTPKRVSHRNVFQSVTRFHNQSSFSAKGLTSIRITLSSIRGWDAELLCSRVTFAYCSLANLHEVQTLVNHNIVSAAVTPYMQFNPTVGTGYMLSGSAESDRYVRSAPPVLQPASRSALTSSPCYCPAAGSPVDS